MPIKIKNINFSSQAPFMQAFNQVCIQSFGGKQDMQLFKLACAVDEAAKAYAHCILKALKDNGRLDPEAGGYTLKGCPEAKLKAYEEYITAFNEGEIELPIEAPIKLKKRKAHRFSSIDAALLMSVIEIEWPEDDGEDLDKSAPGRRE